MKTPVEDKLRSSFYGENERKCKIQKCKKSHINLHTRVMNDIIGISTNVEIMKNVIIFINFVRSISVI